MLVDFCSYNIRGLNNKQNFAKDFVNLHKLSLFALIETRVKKDSASTIANFICPNFSWIFNYDHHYNGRLWVGFDPNIWNLTVISISAQQITCSVQCISTQDIFMVSFVYGFNTAGERRALWDELLAVKRLITDDMAWGMLGDFNTTLGPHETSNGDNWTTSMVDFHDFVTQLGMLDLRSFGPFFTWWDCNIQSPTWKRLDRCLVNDSWLIRFALSQTHVLPRGISDHCPIAVYLGVTQERIRKPFQFFNHLIDAPEFLSKVKDAWQVEVTGNPWFVLTMKLKKVKDSLRTLNRTNGNVHSAVTDSRSKLLAFQTSLPVQPSTLQLEEEAALIKALQQALSQEEILLKQKSRVHWLKHGDQNNKFFFNSCKGRWNSNKILALEDDSGVLHTSHRGISNVAIEFYMGLLGHSNEANAFPEDLSLPSLSESQQEDLIRPFTAADVWNTMKSMARNKSPGPDGLTVEFFMATWSIVGEAVTKGILYFFQTQKLPRIINSTAIALVPKQQHATVMKDFRPIACCNTIYKCITKMISIRLKKILPSLISPYQSAFVPKRLIGDNIFLAQSLCTKYHLNLGQPRCAIKLDIKKAFDTLNWGFLFEALRRMGFPPLFVKWIYTCISTCMISIKVNGSLEGYFKAQSGLRQGDPISPYLFVLAMEVLTACLKKATADPTFKYHWCTKDLAITHLVFADDVMLFSHGDWHSITCLLTAVNEFSGFSGLCPNREKSNCFFANVPTEVQNLVLNFTGFTLGRLPIRYLGLPLITKALSRTDCRPLIMSLRKNIDSWSHKILNHAGRLQLLKVVLFGIQSYWSTHLVLPISVLKDIQSLFVKFLWGGSGSNQKHAKVAWSDCCKPKMEGGLGLRDLCEWSRAAYLYHLWRIIQPVGNSLWVQWFKTTILRNKFFWTMSIPSGASWCIKKILMARIEARRFIRYNVGSNSQFLFWHDPWVNGTILSTRFHPTIISISESNNDAKVGDFTRDTSWNLPVSNHHWVFELRGVVSSINVGSRDEILWDCQATINISAIWDSIRIGLSPPVWVKILWHHLAISKCSFTLWLALKNRLLTKARMIQFGMQTDDICVLCNAGIETNAHLFSTCSFTTSIMSTLQFNFTHCWGSYLNGQVLLGSNSRMKETLGYLALAVVVYFIWQERNLRLHSNGNRSVRLISQLVKRMIREKVFTCKKFQRTASSDNNLISSLY